MKVLLFLLVITRFELIQCSKILALMTCASHSHHIWNSAVTNELAKRGHEVVYFSPDKDHKPLPNVRQIYAENVYEKIYAAMDIEKTVETQGIFDVFTNSIQFGTANCKAVIESNGMDELIKTVKTEKFDLILVDYSITECIYPVIDLLENTPVIGVTAYGGIPISNYIVGNPEMLAIKPSTYLQISGNMTLIQRAQNVLIYLYTMYDRFYNFLPLQQKIAEIKFPNAKDIHGALDRVSLLLVNTHYSFDPPIPEVPSLVSVGGLHIRPPQPLPKDLQQFLDEAKNGAIFFSLGSNLQSSNLPSEKRQILFDTLRELAPIRILWKFEMDLLGKPDNVMIQKWLPQSDILAHPNVKLFITHSGLLSTQEAYYHGKPIIGMPFYVDQFININRCVREGLGVKVDFLTLTKERLLEAIREVLNNPKYKEKAQQVSKIFRDQPETPLQRAMFWIEYVIRHKGAPHLRCRTLDLTWYQILLLDVVLLFVAAISATLLIVYVLIKSIIRLCLGKSKKVKKS